MGTTADATTHAHTRHATAGEPFSKQRANDDQQRFKAGNGGMRGESEWKRRSHCFHHAHETTESTKKKNSTIDVTRNGLLYFRHPAETRKNSNFGNSN